MFKPILDDLHVLSMQIVLQYAYDNISFDDCRSIIQAFLFAGVSVRVANLESVRQQQVERSNEYRELISELSTLCASQEQQVETERQRLIDYKKEVALAAINSRSGKPIPPQVVQSALHGGRCAARTQGEGTCPS